MKLPRSTVYSLLGAAVFASVALRYPTSSHETGVDSFFIHNLTTVIVRSGDAKWILNPLSWFGLFPLSYPSGGPFFLASLASSAGLDVEPTILVASLVFGACGVPTSFAMAREFREDDLFCSSVTLLYAFAPRFLSFTLWTASMRGLFMVILPVFVLLILRTYRAPRVTNFALLVVSFGILAMVHRLGILMVVVLLGSILALIMAIILRILRLQIPHLFLRSAYRRFSSYLALGAIAGVAGVMLLGTNVLDSYSEGQLATGGSIEVELFNLAVSLARSVGLALPFAVAGLFVLVRSRNKTLREPFLVMAFIALIPTLFLRVYTGFYILPFITLLGGMALQSLASSTRRKLGHSLLVVSLLGATAFSGATLGYEIASTTALGDGTYSTATYLAAMKSPGIIANDGLLGVRLASVSGCAYLPVGGAGTTFQSAELLAYGFFSPAEIYQNLTRLPLSDLTLDSDSVWVATSVQAESDWVKIMESPYNRPSPILARYHPSLYVENRFVGTNFYAYGHTYQSAFAQSVLDGAYLLYQSPGESVYYVFTP